MTSPRRFLMVAVVAFVFFAPHLATAQSGLVIPPLTGRVVDRANILSDSEEQFLTQKLADAERTSGAQIVITTLPGLSGYSIETWGLALGNGWKIGHAGKDDGIIIVVAPNDREMRIEVGYGLERRITDREASSIIERSIIPAFRGGNYALGLSDAITALTAQIQNPDAKIDGDIQLGMVIGIVVVILFFVCLCLIIWLTFRRMMAPPIYGPVRTNDVQMPNRPFDNSPTDDATWRLLNANDSGNNSPFGNSWGNGFGSSFGSFGSRSSHSPSLGSFGSSSSHSSGFRGGGGSFKGGGASGKW